MNDELSKLYIVPEGKFTKVMLRLSSKELLAVKDVSINTGLSQGELARAGLLDYIARMQSANVDPTAVDVQYPRV